MSKSKNRSKKNTLKYFNSRLDKDPSLRFASFYVCLALVAITWFIFGQTLRHDFVDFDDHIYVYQNPVINRGLSVAGVLGAFTHPHAGNWHPLTTISHMLDCQLFGLKAGGHHFTNVLLQTIAVLLLFFVLKQMTGAFWPSAFVAAVFAIHPLHVESVAWVSERKDVLSAVFFLLTLGAYVRYARRRSVGRYLTVALCLALGLMSKPMLVTVPFVLLLLDYWPLNRIKGQKSAVTGQKTQVRGQWSVVSGLVMEKIPLLALCVPSCIATLLVNYAKTSMDQLPFTWRLSNAVVSYVAYIWQMFWPAQLAPFYPHPNDQLPLWQVLLASAFLIAVSVLAIHWRKERPYILTGWFWYVGMLVPVIGLVQVGEQARADRYTYLPQIGLYVLIVWGVTNLIVPTMMRNSDCRFSATGSRPLTPGLSRVRAQRPHDSGYKPFCAAIMAAILIGLIWRAFAQTSYWKNSETLWNHTLAVSPANDMAHTNLGYLFIRRGDFDQAISHFEEALEIRSSHAFGHYKLGEALIENNLAAALTQKGLVDEAIDHYEKAARMRPDYGDVYLNLGSILFAQGRTDEAIALWRKAAATQPEDGGFHTILGDAFLKKGLQKDAIAEYEHATRIFPRDFVARNNLAWLLATSSDASIRDGKRAIELAEQTVQLSSGKDANYLRTLAAAYSEVGRFSEAIAVAKQAAALATMQGKTDVANHLKKDLVLYQEQVPLRETSPEN
jgi:tetratricopeptide (TPR) repeat protein